MQPADNHDVTLSIWADWLDDQGRWEEADDIREQIKEETNLEWHYEYRSIGGVGGGGGGGGGGSVGVVGVGVVGVGGVVGGGGGVGGVVGGSGVGGVVGGGGVGVQ